jgi:hypothetical protein
MVRIVKPPSTTPRVTRLSIYIFDISVAMQDSSLSVLYQYSRSKINRQSLYRGKSPNRKNVLMKFGLI